MILLLSLPFGVLCFQLSIARQTAHSVHDCLHAQLHVSRHVRWDDAAGCYLFLTLYMNVILYGDKTEGVCHHLHW